MTEPEIRGRNIRRLRLERGYSQEKLSALMDFKYTQKQISRYERGEVKRPTYEFLELIASVFEIEINDLKDGKYVEVSKRKEID